ncbi:MAG: phosphoribosyl-AMP cyclohydrolase [Pseudomonadales bacterium]|jgi:phosphoribosyl-AMP cyclohydrolase|nr:phosphoribosyl-AMP cyclohydrolase [Pseudomonadales bacterium]MDP4640298.1 phosphoribosyl-AMP cyclohydrolase [Pseudomonadales bacterium]MDP4766434.1 phosphoribosyl-AMP cyclohydrolase [Pseudomonadales bacterium]MDP4875598.1 phosphoribosyl-AMP cyclohydrolase [Pseudomonadales bacterium]MDP5059138.1 phosphoribosyl-AMP cyclohydrolase [Pseudomonadales bacterium]
MPSNTSLPAWLAELRFDPQGLIPAIAQDASSNQILMVAWMNIDAVLATVATGHAVYWSRSRQKLWHKGEESGHQQVIQEVRLDCDSDVLVLRVQQVGGIACHTGRSSCFFRVLVNGEWQTTEPVLKSPADIYS